MISDYINDRLKENDLISKKRFGDIAIYLLHNGVICRPSPGTHSESDPLKEIDLYDDFLLIEDLMVDYLSIIGISIKVDKDHETIRIYPPDADFPGNNTIIEEEESSTLMRMNVTKDLSASLVTLYLLYDQHKSNLNEDYTVVISQVEFLNSFRSKLNIDLAETWSKNNKRKEDTFKELRRLRVIKYHKDIFSSDEQYPIVIRPTIFDLVPETIVKDILYNIENSNNEIEEKSIDV
jgi:hypothetical protein